MSSKRIRGTSDETILARESISLGNLLQEVVMPGGSEYSLVVENYEVLIGDFAVGCEVVCAFHGGLASAASRIDFIFMSEQAVHFILIA